MKNQKPQGTWSRILIIGIMIVSALAIAWLFIVGPSADDYFRPDPCFDAEGVMVSCEG